MLVIGLKPVITCGWVALSGIYARLDSVDVVTIGLVAATLKFQLSG